MPAIRIAQFTSPLEVADVGRAEQYRPIRMLLEHLAYGVGDRESDDRIVVPRGFCCDGASVPPVFHWFFAPWGVYAAAAIVHDYLYATNKRSRREADLIFYQAIIELRSDLDDPGGDPKADNPPTMTGRIIAWIAWAAVRVGGASGYANGANTYRSRAGRAHKRLVEKGYNSLAKKVILEPGDL